MTEWYKIVMVGAAYVTVALAVIVLLSVMFYIPEYFK